MLLNPLVVTLLSVILTVPVVLLLYVNVNTPPVKSKFSPSIYVVFVGFVFTVIASNVLSTNLYDILLSIAYWYATELLSQYIVKLLQFANALFPILVTPDGISILVKLVQYPKAFSPILVTPDGISILVKLVQS